MSRCILDVSGILSLVEKKYIFPTVLKGEKIPRGEFFNS